MNQSILFIVSACRQQGNGAILSQNRYINYILMTILDMVSRIILNSICCSSYKCPRSSSSRSFKCQMSHFWPELSRKVLHGLLKACGQLAYIPTSRYALNTRMDHTTTPTTIMGYLFYPTQEKLYQPLSTDWWWDMSCSIDINMVLWSTMELSKKLLKRRTPSWTATSSLRSYPLSKRMIAFQVRSLPTTIRSRTSQVGRTSSTASICPNKQRRNQHFCGDHDRRPVRRVSQQNIF